MAKSDAFYIRAKVTSNGTTFAQEDIDLGSFVNLGVSKSTLLRVHGIDTQIRPSSYPGSMSVDDAQFAIGWQLTTQSQTTMQYADDKSLVSSGRMQLYGDPNSTAHSLMNNDTVDMNPQSWKNGYLVGVDALYFAVDNVGTTASGEVSVAIVIECTLETATQASATALALSQQ